MYFAYLSEGVHVANELPRSHTIDAVGNSIYFVGETPAEALSRLETALENEVVKYQLLAEKVRKLKREHRKTPT